MGHGWLQGPMAAMAVRVLPQDKATNVRLGAALLAVGVLLVFYAFSGEQAYNLAFFYVAIVGAVLSTYGAVLLANSRVVSERHRRLQRQAKEGVREWVRLECPQCSNVFESEGVRPFTAICPNCASSGVIE